MEILKKNTLGGLTELGLGKKMWAGGLIIFSSQKALKIN